MPHVLVIIFRMQAGPACIADIFEAAVAVGKDGQLSIGQCLVLMLPQIFDQHVAQSVVLCVASAVGNAIVRFTRIALQIE